MLAEIGSKKVFIAIGVVVTSFLVVGIFMFFLRPVSAEGKTTTFIVVPGEGFQDIVHRLNDAHLVRSASFAKLYLIGTGRAHRLQSGMYELSPIMSTWHIFSLMSKGGNQEVSVTIPEGASRFDIDRILSESGVVYQGTFYAYASSSLEGKLFPDTYRFLVGSRPQDITSTLVLNFNMKTASLFSTYTGDVNRLLTIASLLEREVPEFQDRRLVAGIIEKRLRARMPLQIDATICYLKKERPQGTESCYPLSSLDFKIDSPYNTYLYGGLPPHPILNPGLDAIRAALSPKSSEYWFYLSDPVTKKTIFSQTLDIHTQNRIKYLE